MKNCFCVTVLCTVNNNNGAQRYEQFLQVGQLYRALILLGFALCLMSASVSSVVMVLYIYNEDFFAYIILFTF